VCSVRRAGNTELPAVLCFEIKNKSNGLTAHCGVLQFTATRFAAFLPQWMMESLALQDGSLISLRLRPLPTGTSVTFQPMESKFASISNPADTLAHALGKFLYLTEGTTIRVKHGREAYNLKVIAVQPKKPNVDPPAICVLNTQLSVEFKGVEGHTQVEFSEFSVDAPANGEVKETASAHYKFKIPDPLMGVRFRVATTEGQAGLYISTETTPTASTHTWAASSAASDCTTILPSHVSFSKGWWFLVVQGFAPTSTFTLSADLISPDAEEKAGQTVGRVNSSPDAQQCTNCLAWIPSARYVMHTATCARNNWRCLTCNTMMRPSQRAQHAHCPHCALGLDSKDVEMHVLVVHKEERCACGALMQVQALQKHRRDECKLRAQVCQYCNVTFPMLDLEEHQRYCGSRSTPCELCGKPVPARRMGIHLAVDHGVNPCLDSAPGLPRSGNQVVAPSKPQQTPMAVDNELEQALVGTDSRSCLNPRTR
jgi:hypothetical protein